MRVPIVVYIDPEGVTPMVEHILDGSLKDFKPSLTVGHALMEIPVLGKSGQAPPAYLKKESNA